MYKVIIVDDEDLARETLEEIVGWQNFNMEIVGSFSDGSEAIEFLNNNYADIILSDIKMADVSGLDLAKYVDEYHAEIELLLMSGYQDFEYARQAIKYNVFNYLLKPTDYNELIDNLTSVKEKLDKKNMQNEEFLPLLKRQFFCELIMGSLRDENDIVEKMKEVKLGFDIHNSPSTIIRINFVNISEYINTTWKYGNEGFYNAVTNIINNYDNEICFSFININLTEMDVVAIGNNTSKDEFLLKLSDDIANIKEDISSVLGIEAKMNIGAAQTNVFKLSEYYMNGSGEKVFDENIIKYIITCINSKNEKGAVNTLNNVIQVNKKNNKFKYYALRFIDDLYDLVDVSLKQQVQASKKVIQNESNLNSIECELYNVIKKLCYNNLYTEENIIEKAMEYIENNYFSDISLESISAHVALSPAYFSRYFKRQTGDKFIDYVTKFRIDKAKKLLEVSEYKVYEISEMVGYKNIAHFYKLFKMYTGITPNDYRLNVQGEA